MFSGELISARSTGADWQSRRRRYRLVARTPHGPPHQRNRTVPLSTRLLTKHYHINFVPYLLLINNNNDNDEDNNNNNTKKKKCMYVCINRSQIYICPPFISGPFLIVNLNFEQFVDAIVSNLIYNVVSIGFIILCELQHIL